MNIMGNWAETNLCQIVLILYLNLLYLYLKYINIALYWCRNTLDNIKKSQQISSTSIISVIISWIYGRESIVLGGQILEIQILMDLHVFRFFNPFAVHPAISAGNVKVAKYAQPAISARMHFCCLTVQPTLSPFMVSFQLFCDVNCLFLCGSTFFCEIRKNYFCSNKYIWFKICNKK